MTSAQEEPREDFKVKKTKVETWDFTELLDTEEKIATYIRVALEEAGDDPIIIAKTLAKACKTCLKLIAKR